MSSITPLPQTRWVLFEQTCYDRFPERDADGGVEVPPSPPPPPQTKQQQQQQQQKESASLSVLMILSQQKKVLMVIMYRYTYFKVRHGCSHLKCDICVVVHSKNLRLISNWQTVNIIPVLRKRVKPRREVDSWWNIHKVLNGHSLCTSWETFYVNLELKIFSFTWVGKLVSVFKNRRREEPSQDCG